MAVNEAAKFAGQSLDDDAKRNEHSRTQHLRSTLHVAVTLGVWLGFVLVVIAVFCFAFHELAPVRWWWMTPEQVSQLRTFIFSSATTSVITTYFKRRL